jgi:hypothetical protein
MYLVHDEDQTLCVNDLALSTAIKNISSRRALGCNLSL